MRHQEWRPLLIARLSDKGAPPVFKARHWIGSPPGSETESEDRVLLPWPKVIILAESSQGLHLSRYAADGTFAGETWHESLEMAKRQAAFEYGESLGEWREVPDGISDPVALALRWGQAE
jgi:hypothetical protein